MDLSRLFAGERAAFLLALQFLTRLPLPEGAEWSEAAARRSPGWYPAVGLLLGLGAAGVFLLAGGLLPQVMAALLAVAVLTLATGALHEDGLADLCDGIGGARGDPARALEIMRDSRIGTYGALGLGLVLALRVLALALMPFWSVPFALVAGAVLSRVSMVRAMAAADYARPSGAGSAVAGEMADAVLQRALLTGAVVAVVTWPFLGFFAGVLGALALALAHVGLRRIYEPRLGGWTGDCLGAMQVTGEVAFLVGLLAGMG